MPELIKTLLRDDAFFYATLILLVGVASFGLGRLSVVEQPVVMQQAAKATLSAQHTASVAAAKATTTRRLVGSVNGTKYHYQWCPSAGMISEENRVYFASSEEARTAGYTPAANCAGLE